MNPAFVTQMQIQLGAEAELYFDALQKDYVRGIRLNEKKIRHILPDGILDRVPWAGSQSYYLSNDSEAGAHPLHEAGAWYIQEPSAMASVSVLNPQPGESILDLCAAPGGKSTQIAQKMQGKGLLVCNEPVLNRARILSRNIERIGISNALVVNADPETLANSWKERFDAVLVDAPCSGEGMFRRHPETQEQWQEGSPEGCAIRQAAILEQAIRMVKPGGRLVYSTCTFNTLENEGVIRELLKKHREWKTKAFKLNGAGEAPEGMLHLYPHIVRGEGHFVALLIKNEGSEVFLRNEPFPFPTPDSEMLRTWEEFAHGRRLPSPNAVFGEILLSTPALPPLKGIHVLRAGLQLGTRKGKVFEPDHALALSITEDSPFPGVELTLEEAHRFQAGETLSISEQEKGWMLPMLDGVVLGFGKASGGQLKNHYPKGLRKPLHK